MTQDQAYWQNFYAQQAASKALQLPSQFAAFVSNEISRNSFVVDLGCGNGRDALFFGRHGFDVLGIDRSENAVAFCQDKAPEGCEFAAIDLAELNLSKEVADRSPDGSDGLVIYSRFFLHAIDRDLQRVFLEQVASLAEHKPKVFLEFRTDQDAERVKVTEEHYRRYVDLAQFERDLADFGLSVTYKTEGTGFAKYKDDDAHVARYVLV